MVDACSLRVRILLLRDMRCLLMIISLVLSLAVGASPENLELTDSVAISSGSMAFFEKTANESPTFSIPDSLSIVQEDYSQYKPFKEISFMGAPLIISGFIVKSQKKEFRAIRNNFEPHFEKHLDDYLQYTPLAATYIMKAFGVKGRSKWRRLVVSNVFSAAIMAGMVNVIKYSTKEIRPDGSSADAFPSGHTATAFMAATILHKEYGMTRSPWYSVGGYAIASATGLMRVLNNRHWISDVLVGAGVGIFSVDFGYMFADLIFKDKYLEKGLNHKVNMSLRSNPSFCGIGISAGFLRQSVHLPYDPNFKKSPTLSLGTATSSYAEGAYFINPYVGFGGQIKATTLPVKVIDGYFDLPELDKTIGLRADNMSAISLDAGVYVQYPFCDAFSVGAKFLGGRQHTADLKMEIDFSNEDRRLLEEMGITDFTYLNIPSSESFKFATGVSASYCYKNNMTMRLSVDYDWSRSRHKISIPIDDGEGFEMVSSATRKIDLGILSLGCAIVMSF